MSRRRRLSAKTSNSTFSTRALTWRETRRVPQEPASDALTSPFGSHAHAQRTGVGKPHSRHWAGCLAKSNDLPLGKRGRLRQITVDNVLQKRPGVFQGPSMDRSQIPLFPGDSPHGVAH